MTCIAGLVHDGTIYMGGDSAGVADYVNLRLRADSKVFHNGPFLFGFTTSFRMGQLLRYQFSPPKHHPDVDTYKFMVTEFIDAVRQCLKHGGFAQKNNEEESGGTFLVGYKGRLFMVDSDYQVGEQICGYCAVGCGAQVAHGALHATSGLAPEDRIRMALEAAEQHSSGVRGPFKIERQGGE